MWLTENGCSWDSVHTIRVELIRDKSIRYEPNRLRVTKIRQRLFGLLTVAALEIVYKPLRLNRFEFQAFGRIKNFHTVGFIFVSRTPGPGRYG